MYIGFSAIIALTFNGPHRIDSRAIPDGQLPCFSEQILLLFFSPTVERNIWVKIRHTILRSSLQLIGIILTGDADRMLIIDPICDDFLSFSYPTRNVFQWASSTWLHIFWVERSEKLHGSDGRANESSWRERVSAMGKKYRVEKPRFFPPGWKDIDRLRDQKGISHYN